MKPETTIFFQNLQVFRGSDMLIIFWLCFFYYLKNYLVVLGDSMVNKLNASKMSKRNNVCKFSVISFFGVKVLVEKGIKINHQSPLLNQHSTSPATLKYQSYDVTISSIIVRKENGIRKWTRSTTFYKSCKKEKNIYLINNSASRRT